MSRYDLPAIAESVVPTRQTAALAAAMIASARREGSGAEAVILHLDNLAPGQGAALVGLLLDACVGRSGVIEPWRFDDTDECLDCRTPHPVPQRRGLCTSCYQRHTRNGTVVSFARKQRRLRSVS